MFYEQKLLKLAKFSSVNNYSAKLIITAILYNYFVVAHPKKHVNDHYMMNSLIKIIILCILILPSALKR